MLRWNPPQDFVKQPSIRLPDSITINDELRFHTREATEPVELRADIAGEWEGSLEAIWYKQPALYYRKMTLSSWIGTNPLIKPMSAFVLLAGRSKPAKLKGTPGSYSWEIKIVASYLGSVKGMPELLNSGGG